MMYRSLMLSLLLTGTGAPALAVQGINCLSLREVVQLAADRDPRIDGARARLGDARADMSDALALRRPQISAFARTSAGDNGLTSSQIENQLGVQLSQRVLDFGDARLARSAARDSIAGREFDIQTAQLLAARDAARAALDLSRAAEFAGLIAERVAYFEELVSRLQRLLETGGTTRDALASVEARLAEARSELVEITLQRNDALTRYMTLLGESLPACPVSIEEGVLSAIRADSLVAGVPDVDYSANPQLRSLQSQLRAATAEQDRERRSRLPAIDFVAIGSYTYDDFTDDWDFRDRVGVDVSVPLYSGDRLRARSQRAAAQRAGIESQITLLQRELDQQTRSSVRRILALEALLESRAVAAEQKQRELEAIELAFASGQRTLYDLLETRIGLFEARMARVSVRYSLYEEYLTLAATTATLDIELAAPEGPNARRIWGWEPDPLD